MKKLILFYRHKATAKCDTWTLSLSWNQSVEGVYGLMAVEMNDFLP